MALAYSDIETYTVTYRAARETRGRISAALALRMLSDSEPESIDELVGCSVDQLATHLQSLFEPGMKWENMGEWFIGHISPWSEFDLKIQAQQREYFHYANLQPLWSQMKA